MHSDYRDECPEAEYERVKSKFIKKNIDIKFKELLDQFFRIYFIVMSQYFFN